MAVTMSQLLGIQGDVVEDCRKKTKALASNAKYRMSIEVLLKDGTRRFYIAKELDQKKALREVLTFVAAIESATGEKVMWRRTGEKTYHMSTNYTSRPSLVERAKSAFLSYFFDIEN
ncbi:DUF6018 family natural product bioysynthesis protein [Robertmurraya sp. GLU-23]